MILEIFAAAVTGGLVGFFACAALTQAAIADSNAEVEDWQSWLGLAVESEREHREAHTRAADALTTLKARIDRALECETANAAHGVKKMARILRGDA